MRVPKAHAELLARKGFVTVSEAARKTGYHQVTIRRWIEDGGVDTVTVGPVMYVEWKSIVERLGPETAKALGLVK